MQLIFKIAWRNIFRHKGKSIIIGVILFLGSLLMTVGSSVISGMDRGLEKNIVNGFIGDFVIISDKEKSDNVFFKIYGESINTILNYTDIRDVLKKQNYLKEFLPIGKNVLMVLNEEDGDPGYTMILGVDLKAYTSFFPDNFKIVEGDVEKLELIEKRESGIVVPLSKRQDLYDQMNVWLIPENSTLVEANLSEEAKDNLKDLNIKDTAVFMGLSSMNSTSDIRLKVKAIIRYSALNKIWGHFAIMDIESYRKCLGYFGASDTSTEISDDKRMLLELENQNIDNLFGSTDVLVSATTDKSEETDDKVSAATGKSGTTDNKVLTKNSMVSENSATASSSASIDLEAGVYNLVLVKLKDGVTLEDGINRLNSALALDDLGVRAVTWKKASGFIGSMATIIKGALFLFVTVLFFVAIIIIVNTLTMAAIERTTEIGMMRAIGAGKWIIAGMFICETALLSGLFGGIGIITGIVVVYIVPFLKIASANDLVQLLFGGDTFNPYLSIGDIAVVLVELVVVTLITIIYPVILARSITPLDAISRD
ncbi:MAG: FtsX-like permease family protein [Desulfamplus sp.]|nr:FtsX-like permease family protein [Desulfamplus sp.]